jgi:large subunit ribosomal protein L7Ae
VVHKKTATALALTSVKNEDQREFAKLVESFKVRQRESMGPWGGFGCPVCVGHQALDVPTTAHTNCGCASAPHVMLQAQFNDGPRVNWGGGIMGMKSQHKTRARERVLAKELAQRMAV